MWLDGVAGTVETGGNMPKPFVASIESLVRIIQEKMDYLKKSFR